MIAIDPNIRVTHNHTFTFVDNPRDFYFGDALVAVEEETGATWPATVALVRGDGYLELAVAWREGTYPDLDVDDG